MDAANSAPFFKEREVWWCSIGQNIGHEQDGKNAKCNRPVLIVKKFNDRLFWGVPLSTQIKQSIHYHVFTFQTREQCAMLTQMRLWDGNRLTEKMGRLAKNDFADIRRKLSAYLQ